MNDLPTQLATACPSEFRLHARRRAWTGPTAGMVPGFAQANLVVLPRANALEFLRFCLLNWAACPVLEVLPAGTSRPLVSAPTADLRTDLPRYRVYRDGERTEEVLDASPYWYPDMVAVLLGCSFTADHALRDAGVPVRHAELRRADPTYMTRVPCLPTEHMRTDLLVSMRPVPRGLVSRATEVTMGYVRAHGAPLSARSPAELGIEDLQRPDHGEAMPLGPEEVPMFWACGLTALAAALSARPSLVLSHAPGHMFITDLPHEALTRMDAAHAGHATATQATAGGSVGGA